MPTPVHNSAARGRDTAVAQLANRFVSFSLCRADLLFELDNNYDIKFVGGTTGAILNRTSEELIGTPFLDLVNHVDRPMIDGLLRKTAQGGRLDDVGFRVRLKNGSSQLAAIAGYRVPDFDNHFFWR